MTRCLHQVIWVICLTAQWHSDNKLYEGAEWMWRKCISVIFLPCIVVKRPILRAIIFFNERRCRGNNCRSSLVSPVIMYIAITADDVLSSVPAKKVSFFTSADTRKRCRRDDTIFRHSSIFNIELAAKRVDTRRVSARGDADFGTVTSHLAAADSYKRDFGLRKCFTLRMRVELNGSSLTIGRNYKIASPTELPTSNFQLPTCNF